MSRLFIPLLFLGLVSCASQPELNVVSVEEDLAGKSIANIRPVGVRLAKMPSPEADTQKAIAKYQRFLEIAPQGETRVHVMHRLADLKLMDVEELLADNPEQLDAEQVKQVYDEAIQTYTQVLTLFPHRRDSDMLLYQLSKVYMLKGDDETALSTLTRLVNDFPNSSLLSEVQYRRGDILFNLERFAEANEAFAYVAMGTKENRFFISANYMRGWSQFKLRAYENALLSFTKVIDERFVDTTAIVTASKGDKELLDDTVRVMSMIFAEGKGHKQIVQLMRTIGQRHYEYLLYDSLAEYYIAKQQYSDAARTYQAFVSANPTDVLAPAFYSSVVNSYKKAGYVDLVLKHKVAYIEQYGVRSAYWNIYGEDIRDMIRPNIKDYSSQLAQYHHSRGQKAKNIKTKFNELLSASRWYQEYIDTFPNDNKVGEMYFLKGEAVYEVGRYEEAILAYTQGGYETPKHEKSEESAYAALVAYNRMIDKVKPEEKNFWLERKVDSALRYSMVFPENKNTSQVLARAAEGLFSLGQFQRAVDVSQSVLARQDANPQQRSVANLIKAHSHFDLAQYAEAEVAYVAALQSKQLKKTDISAVNEKLAASIYKQAVAWVEKDVIDKAVKDFMRVGKAVPSSPIRITAHYDAASYLMKKQKWEKAEEILLSFRESYPKDKLVADIPSKLIIAYENLKEWKKAAYELQNIWRFSRDKKEQRIALYQAAEYYEKADDIDNAMTMLKRYAHNYPKPFDAQLEAINKLEGLYLKQKDHEKRRYWLEKLIAADATAGKSRSDRSKFLAAKASFELADYERQTYAQIELTLPLQKSLGRKKVALKRTLDAYQRTAKMEVQEFTTAATFQIAEIYGELSRDLMASQRPAGLDELELEEYEYLLEDQAFPFEEAAINIHETNIKRSWDGLYDGWISKSISALSKLMPARYAKKEVSYEAIAEIH
ncbi:MAG: tetratricopeptide repeat protein [Gammaproteobacteria bacterium]|nr:tetratricopeptide repeat protein [Gammaproteobacteria bacterium]